MFSCVHSAAYYGIEGYIVKIEAHIARGLPHFKIVGLPDKSVEESKDRVTAAIKSSGFTFPLRRITINLAPSHIPKHGPSLDLPIALSILLASGQIELKNLINFENSIFCGELGLDGTLKPVKGDAILFSIAQSKKYRYLIIPRSGTFSTTTKKNACLSVLFPRTLKEAVLITRGKNELCWGRLMNTAHVEKSNTNVTAPNFFPAVGCQSEIRALTIACAGKLHLALYGPPGCGKTLIAQSILSIAPDETEQDRQERELIYSTTDEPNPPHRPFRQPNTSISHSGMFGGGRPPCPGEVTLAHRGFLFLDEFSDFSKNNIAALRKVLDTKTSVILDKNNRISFPADFLLITAMNRCPCGYLGHPTKPCRCLPYHIKQYQSRISNSVWDRIALHLEMKSDNLGDFREKMPQRKTHSITENISNAIEMQKKRRLRNCDIPLATWRMYAPMASKALSLLEESQTSLSLSTRRLLNTIRIARTIADLDSIDEITENHVAEALSYRKVEN